MRDLNLKTRDGRQAFYNSNEWRTLRNYKIQSQPLCEECFKKDKLVPATEVHHITDIANLSTFENALNYDGLLSLCKSCHSSITQHITQHKKRHVWAPFNLKEFIKNNNIG